MVEMNGLETGRPRENDLFYLKVISTSAHDFKGKAA